MSDNLKCGRRRKIVTTFAVFLFAATSSKLFAPLVPVKILLAYAAAETYEHEMQFEDRRHNLELLKFRNQTRAAEAKNTQDMIDCANTPPEDNCAKKAANELIRATKAIQKQEIMENKRHLDNLDKIATNYAFGKH
jgi:hypothetical protein